MEMRIEDLERLNKLPKMIASPGDDSKKSGMDLEKLRRIDEHIRRQWWDEVRRAEAEYFKKYVPEGETNKFLEANISMSKLKLVVSFLDNGEQCPEHKFKEYEIEFLRDFENELPQVRRLSTERLAEYYHNKGLRGELGGFVGLVFDAVRKRSNVIDEIIGRSDIPDDLAKAFDRVYGTQIQKIQEALQMMITKWGIEDLYANINSVLERAEKERKEVEGRISEEIERRLNEFEDAVSFLEADKVRLEKKVLDLEKELSLSSDVLKRLEEERASVRRDYEEKINEHASILGRLNEELRRLEEAKEELQNARVRSEEEKMRVEEELSKLSGLSERVREEVEELRSENADLRRRKEEMDALIDSFREEDVFFDGITKEDARLREMDYVKRVEGRLKEKPIDGGKWRKVEVLDERGKIYDELRALRAGFSYDSLREIPNGLRIRAERGFWKREVFEVRILSHYKELFLNGLDRRKTSLREVMPYIDELRGKDGHVLALASLTGWSAEAIEYVEQRAQYPVILVDLRNEGAGKYYNRANLNLKKFLYYV